MTALSLFSGIGGLDVGLKLACPEVRHTAYVERDAYCQQVLRARMQDGCLDAAPIFDDVTTFDGTRHACDLICGGFPCQDISNAGRREGISGSRSGLWSEFARIIREVAPRYVFVENVAALLGRGMDRVLGDLSELGFDAEWGVFSAADVGAPHLRKRVFILAYSRCFGDGADQSEPFGGGGRAADTGTPCGDVGYADRQHGRRLSVGTDREPLTDASREGLLGDTEGVPAVFSRPDEPEERQGAVAAVPIFPPGPADRERWAAVLRDAPHLEPAVCRMAARFPRRVDRLRCLGNAVLPLVAADAFRTLAARIGK